MLSQFEKICRSAWKVGDEPPSLHEFESRDIHQLFFGQVKKLFDDGHYRQCVFEACQIIENAIQNIAESNKIGRNLMEEAFNANTPLIPFCDITTEKGKKEQRGYLEIYCGMIGAVRNPPGHDSTRIDDMQGCLSLLGFLSAICRFVEKTGLTMDPYAQNH